MVECYDN